MPAFLSEAKQAYNDDKDEAPVVSQRKTRSRQETLEASSFTVVATIKEKAAAEEGEEGVDVDAKALLTTTATPFKLKQVRFLYHLDKGCRG